MTAKRYVVAVWSDTGEKGYAGAGTIRWYAIGPRDAMLLTREAAERIAQQAREQHAHKPGVRFEIEPEPEDE